MAGYLSATRGLFANYGNTPRSDQTDTITARLPGLPFINRLLASRPLRPCSVL
jgi:hypothetical protein